MNMAASRKGILMSAKMKMLMGLLLLTLALGTTGCSVLLYEDGYDHSGEIVLIPAEDPPIIIVCPGPHIPPPPPPPVYYETPAPAPVRHRPLAKPDSPRIKTPRGDRSRDQVAQVQNPRSGGPVTKRR